MTRKRGKNPEKQEVDKLFVATQHSAPLQPRWQAENWDSSLTAEE
jgi:hypothetical protein